VGQLRHRGEQKHQKKKKKKKKKPAGGVQKVRESEIVNKHRDEKKEG